MYLFTYSVKNILSDCSNQRPDSSGERKVSDLLRTHGSQTSLPHSDPLNPSIPNAALSSNNTVKSDNNLPSSESDDKTGSLPGQLTVPAKNSRRRYLFPQAPECKLKRPTPQKPATPRTSPSLTPKESSVPQSQQASIPSEPNQLNSTATPVPPSKQTDIDPQKDMTTHDRPIIYILRANDRLAMKRREEFRSSEQRRQVMLSRVRTSLANNQNVKQTQIPFKAAFTAVFVSFLYISLISDHPISFLISCCNYIPSLSIPRVRTDHTELDSSANKTWSF